MDNRSQHQLEPPVADSLWPAAIDYQKPDHMAIKSLLTIGIAIIGLGIIDKIVNLQNLIALSGIALSNYLKQWPTLIP